MRQLGGDGGIISGIRVAPLLTDERPQRLDARSREVGVGHSEYFADGSGGYGGVKKIQCKRIQY